MLTRFAVAAAAIAMTVSMGGSVAFANAQAIQARKDILKTFGPASRAPGLMLRGEQAFDLATVQAALKVFAEGAPKLPALFPPDSQTGDTKALPVIWTEKDKFNAIFAKLEADPKAAMTAITNEATFRTEMPKVLGNCGACHNPYRAR
jgi:cytochrome c556